MKSPAKILIVEDEMIIGANISLQLSKLGYDVTGIVSRGEEAITHLKQNRPDIVLMDIQLKGNMDGIETASKMQTEIDIPIIYLTANADDEHFERAKSTHPYAFISKPFKKLDLQHAIELTLERLNNKNNNVKPLATGNSPFILSDSIFIRRNERMIKILIKDIYYFEADRNYCKIYAKKKECLLVMTLKEINDKLPPEHFLRIHRSFIINLSHVDEVAGTHVVIGKKAIPLSKTMRSELMNRLQTF
ncbi:LytR/AlgR family response regulator transcription factor [Lutimonas zeaxanthinifaciens]|uniref:LytR/AlgR family response regulator transcription factor n=1 Tax=Lutimonas zeaxanthinifaciens TaxID=3060215 RepID=UPI00265D531D|nr:response regulator [Lutimonas sp. YSD2104]WKK65574.1 response regulator [Lutimonas sp. YSD2104]